LITHRFSLDRAEEAYDVILGGRSALGVLLEYPMQVADAVLARTIDTPVSARRSQASKPRVALVGAGQHALRMLLPAIHRSGAELAIVGDQNGLSAAHAARRFGFAAATTDTDKLLADPAVDTVFIATRHDTHAALVCAALRAGKNVFVEKPLAIRPVEIDDIRAAYRTASGILMVDFNRRFAPHVVKIRELLSRTPGQKTMVMTVNSGALPADHWTQDAREGGGRVAGEACHFIDLLRFLAGSPIGCTQVTRMNADTVTIALQFERGDTGVVHYFSNGHKSFPKERLEIFCDGRILQLDNFRVLRGYGWPDFRRMRAWTQDKGHVQAVSAFVAAIRSGSPSPIPFDEMIEIAEASLDAAR
jgi:predicted dehydrogenase